MVQHTGRSSHLELLYRLIASGSSSCPPCSREAQSGCPWLGLPVFCCPCSDPAMPGPFELHLCPPRCPPPPPPHCCLHSAIRHKLWRGFSNRITNGSPKGTREIIPLSSFQLSHRWDRRYRLMLSRPLPLCHTRMVLRNNEFKSKPLSTLS